MDEVQVRVGDAERRAVDERLQAAVGDGRLTLHEYEQRAGEVWAARTRGELEATTADLPPAAAPFAPAARQPAGRMRSRRAVAVMSGDRLTGPVAPGQAVEAYAVMGGAVIDLRGAQLPAEVHVRAVAVMGGIEVLVPHGTCVQLSGAAFMGGRNVAVDPPRADAPVVYVQAYALMGGVEVKHGEGVNAPVSLTKEVAPLPPAAVRPHGSHPHGSRVARQPHRHSLRNRVVVGVVVLAAAFGLSGVVGADDAVVFGSRTVTVPARGSVDVASLFGSITVVVPNDATVVEGGTVVFGSTDCKACNNPNGDQGNIVNIHGRGAFGSIEIVTQSQQAADKNDDGDN